MDQEAQKNWNNLIVVIIILFSVTLLYLSISHFLFSEESLFCFKIQQMKLYKNETLGETCREMLKKTATIWVWKEFNYKVGYTQ